MLTPIVLTELRVAATFNHQFLALSTRLVSDGQLVAEVAFPPSPRPPECVVGIHPCGFRNAVVHAWHQHLDGQPIQFLGGATDPDVEICVAPGGSVAPSGILAIPVVDHLVYAFASSLDPDACHEHGRDLFEAFDPPSGVRGLGIRGDADTQVSIVYAEVDPSTPPGVEDAVVDVLEALLARLETVVLIESLVESVSLPSRWTQAD